MRRSLKGKVVVVTGASSGIGRAAALSLARRGALVVCAARREEPLVELVKECQALGTQALAVATDVTRRADIERLARQAFSHFGRIDAWVNNAGVYMIGELEQTPDRDIEQLFRTNVLAYFWCAKAALPYFERQHSGHFINVSSVFGKSTGPMVTAYAASKFAVRGFSEALREELKSKDIEVSTIYPPSVDTPLWDHTANFAGRRVKPANPTYAPETIGEAIAKCVEKPKRDVTFAPGKIYGALHTLFPRLYDAQMQRYLPKDHFFDEPAPRTEGNLFSPVEEGRGLRSELMKEKGSKRRIALLAAAAAVPAALALRRLAT